MRGALENAHQFADVDVLLDRNDIRARNHDVAHPAFTQPEDVLEHPAFFRREAGFTGAHDIEDVLEVCTHGARLPAEQRAAGTRTGWIAVRHGGHASSDARATYGSGMLRRTMILLSSPSISSACA